MRFFATLLRLTAATVLVAAVGLVLPVAPASAATCSGSAAVSVVVDFHELGSGVQTACVAGGGTARSLFERAGFALADVQRQPGFVCRVNGQPDNDPCVNTPPTSAYWGLWWSDGKSGQWTYATTSAGGLSVPEGGYVALSWNGSSSRSAPGLSPAAHAAAPTPSTKPSTKASTKPSTKPTKPAIKPSTKSSTKSSTTSTKTPGQSASSSPSSTASSTPSASPSKQPTKQQSGKAGQPTKPPGGVDGEMLPDSPQPSTDGTGSTDAAPVATDPPDSSGGGLPTWVGPVVVAVLFAAGAAVAVVRRRRNPTP